MKGFFVTGTGTEVGKTVVSVALIGALKGMGMRVCGMKPVESGCHGEAQDGMALLSASGVPEPIENITPFTYKAPLAPLVAARQEGHPVDPAVIRAKALELASRHDSLVVEGVGGLMVPVAEGGYLVRDMALELGLPVVVAASVFLGTINHTLLTVEALRRSGLTLAGVVLTYHESAGAVPSDMLEAARTNPAIIEELMGEPLLGVLPYMENLTPPTVMAEGVRLLRTDLLGRFL